MNSFLINWTEGSSVYVQTVYAYNISDALVLSGLPADSVISIQRIPN